MICESKPTPPLAGQVPGPRGEGGMRQLPTPRSNSSPKILDLQQQVLDLVLLGQRQLHLLWQRQALVVVQTLDQLQRSHVSDVRFWETLLPLSWPLPPLQPLSQRGCKYFPINIQPDSLPLHKVLLAHGAHGARPRHPLRAQEVFQGEAGASSTNEQSASNTQGDSVSEKEALSPPATHVSPRGSRVDPAEQHWGKSHKTPAPSACRVVSGQ